MKRSGHNATTAKPTTKRRSWWWRLFFVNDNEAAATTAKAAEASRSTTEPLPAPESLPPLSRRREIVPVLKQTAPPTAVAKPSKPRFRPDWRRLKSGLLSALTLGGSALPVITLLSLVTLVLAVKARIDAENTVATASKRYDSIDQKRVQSEAALPDLAPLAHRFSRWSQGGFIGPAMILEWDSALSKVQRHFAWNDMSWQFLSEQEADPNRWPPLTATTLQLQLASKNLPELYNMQQLLSAYVGNDGPLIFIRQCKPIRETTLPTSECLIDWVTARALGKSGQPLPVTPSAPASNTLTAPILTPPIRGNAEPASSPSVTTITVTPAAAANRKPTVSEPAPLHLPRERLH